jgi:hypothetical protein
VEATSERRVRPSLTRLGIAALIGAAFGALLPHLLAPVSMPSKPVHQPGRFEGRRTVIARVDSRQVEQPLL